MESRTGIGGNNPPEDQKITDLSPADEVAKIIKKDVESLAAEYDELLGTFSRMPENVTEQDVYDKCVAVIAAMRNLNAKREEVRKNHKDPYLKATQLIDKAFKLENDQKEDRSKLLDNAVKTITDRLSEFDTAEYNRKREAAELESAKISEQARQDGIEISVEANVDLASRRSEYGGTSIKTIVREWEVTDEELLPRSVLSVDPKKVQALVDQGAKIPGITVKERVETVVRRS